jgi:WD40 repeat protein
VVKVWDYTNGFSDDTLLKTFCEHSGPVNALAYVGDGNQLASAGVDGKIIIRRIDDGIVIHTLFDSNPITSLAASPDGKILLSAGSGLKFWRVADGALLYAFDKEAQGVGAVAITADGRYFAYGRADGAVVYAHMPVVLEESRLGDDIVLHWTGGSGLYRVQRRNHPVRGEWHNFGPPTTATSFTNAITREPVFYRVVSLPNP